MGGGGGGGPPIALPIATAQVVEETGTVPGEENSRMNSEEVDKNEEVGC